MRWTAHYSGVFNRTFQNMVHKKEKKNIDLIMTLNSICILKGVIVKVIESYYDINAVEKIS